MNNIYPRYHDLSLDNEHLQSFSAQLNKKKPAIKIPVIDNALPLGNCYWNVDSFIRKYGGEMILGWEINLFARSHLDAVHHAIYKSQDGKLLDVTEKMPNNMNMKETVFVPSDQYIIDLNKRPLIGMQFFVINKNNFLINYIKAYRKVNVIEKEQSSFLYRIGDRCQNNRKIADGAHPTGMHFEPLDIFNYERMGVKLNKAKVKLTQTRIALEKHLSEKTS